MQDLKEEIIKYSKIKGLIKSITEGMEHDIYELEEVIKNLDLNDKEVINEVKHDLNTAKAKLKFITSDSLEERWCDEYYEEFTSSMSEEDGLKVLESLRLNALVSYVDTKVGVKFNTELELASEFVVSKNTNY